MPSLTPVVRALIITNVVVFLLEWILTARATAAGGASTFIERWFALLSSRPGQIWRLLTFQFLHAGFWHLAFNMLGLYFLGTALERHWGARTFLVFYLVCGLVGGLVFLAAGRFSAFFGGQLVGASGSVLGLLTAAAVLFPQFVVIIFIFPVPIRWAVVGFTIWYLLNVLNAGANAGGDLCHLGGMATGLAWVFVRPKAAHWWHSRRADTWQTRLEDERKLQFEVDRILDKVRENGIRTLSRQEKATLQRASELQRRRDAR